MMFSVYCHTNKINGKKYVGITAQHAHARWQNGKHYERHSKFYSEIKAFGWDAFDHEILFSNLTKEEAEIKEKMLINEWNLTDSSKGYNVMNGGLNLAHHSDETKLKMSLANRGNKNPFYHCKHKEETKLLMAQNRPRKAVLCMETGITFKSLREAERLTGADHGDISKCCNHKKKTCGGFHWEFSDERS